MTLINKSRSILFNHWPLLFSLVLFLGLLLKNPFSDRTLIPNFEPFPDPFYYVVPPRCFLSGQGWRMCRPGVTGSAPIVVPPLYSVVLLPFLALSSDPRIFYLGNVVLAVAGLSLFYLICKKTIKNTFITSFLLILYVTNYFIYWYPSLAMAENLILPLFLGCVWLLLSQPRVKSIVVGAGLAVAISATKPAFVPLTLIFLGAFFIKALMARDLFRPKERNLISLFIIISGTVFFLVSFRKFEWVVTSLIKSLDKSNPSPWFSLLLFPENVVQYLRAVQGYQLRFLWDYTPFLARWLAMPALLGLGFGLLKKKFQVFSLILVLSLLGQIFFMATFYSLDARYIYHAIPILLFGFGIFLKIMLDQAKQHHKQKWFYLGLAVIFGFYCFQNMIRIKSQLVLNLKYAESPWWYLAVDNVNQFYYTLPQSQKKPVIATIIPPHLVDFFIDERFIVLPLSPQQDFRSTQKQVWGDHDYQDLIGVYQGFIEQGHRVYVTDYGFATQPYLAHVFKRAKVDLVMEKKQSGCHDLCNIYQLTLSN